MSTVLLLVLYALGVDAGWERLAPWYVVAPMTDSAFWIAWFGGRFFLRRRALSRGARNVLLAALLLLSPFVAAAQTVGPTCTLFWNAPTTNADGTPLATPIGSYRVYVTSAATPVPVPGTTVPTATVSAGANPAPTSWNCAGVGLGQHFAWVTAVNANGESAVQPAPLAFTYVGILPGSPTGVRVTP